MGKSRGDKKLFPYIGAPNIYASYHSTFTFLNNLMNWVLFLFYGIEHLSNLLNVTTRKDWVKKQNQMWLVGMMYHYYFDPNSPRNEYGDIEHEVVKMAAKAVLFLIWEIYFFSVRRSHLWSWWGESKTEDWFSWWLIALQEWAWLLSLQLRASGCSGYWVHYTWHEQLLFVCGGNLAQINHNCTVSFTYNLNAIGSLSLELGLCKIPCSRRLFVCSFFEKYDFWT